MAGKKVVDESLGIDYTKLIDDQRINTEVISFDDINNEDNELIREFLISNKDVKPYIDKALFDPQALVAMFIIHCCKDRNYTVKVNGSDYRLPLAIMMKAMGDCYNYIVEVAKALADARGDKTKIQLSDEAVMEIAENYFKLGDKKASVKVIDPNKKSVPVKKESTENAEPEKKEDDKQLSFFL